MAQVDLKPLIDQLDDNIDDLEEALAPLLAITLSDSASQLPLLDRAKLYVLNTYAIESLIFSFLRLNGVNAKSHPVFAELTRVKQYFEKIKVAESGEQKRTLSLDKDAANRFIKHDLAQNNRLDANGSSTPLTKTGIHTRFPAETNKKTIKINVATTIPSHKSSKAKEIRDSISELSRSKTESNVVMGSTPESVPDASQSSSSIKRPREAELPDNSGDESKPKNSKKKKRKDKKLRRAER